MIPELQDWDSGRGRALQFVVRRKPKQRAITKDGPRLCSDKPHLVSMPFQPHRSGWGNGGQALHQLAHARNEIRRRAYHPTLGHAQPKLPDFQIMLCWEVIHALNHSPRGAVCSTMHTRRHLGRACRYTRRESSLRAGRDCSVPTRCFRRVPKRSEVQLPGRACRRDKFRRRHPSQRAEPAACIAEYGTPAAWHARRAWGR